jgi:hypothetical protein
MIESQHKLWAKYQVHRNLFVICRVEVTQATATGFKAQIGIRQPGDTIVPVGTRLYLLGDNVASLPQKTAQGYELFYVNVEGIDISYGMPVQVCSPIQREIQPDRRRTVRQPTSFPLILTDMETPPYTVVSAHAGGLTMVDNNARPFVGLGLGNTYHLAMSPLREPDLIFPITIRHIQYDWMENQHRLGVQINRLSKLQTTVLLQLIKGVALAQATTVDTGSGLIRGE